VPDEIKAKVDGLAKQMNVKEPTDTLDTENTVDENPSKPNE
jgi:hypothetical protein